MNTARAFVESALAGMDVSAPPPPPKPSDDEVRHWARIMVAQGYRPRNEESFVKLAAWLAGPRTKGLVLLGETGVGKTHFFECCTSSRIARAGDLLPHAESEIETGESTTLSLVVDDLGTEPVRNHFGQRHEALADIIAARYLSWQRYGTLLHVTTNQRREELRARYGDRTMDRLREMCYFHEITGTSARA